MFFSKGNSFVIVSRISFTVFTPSQCFQIHDPSESRFASKVFCRRKTLQKDLPSFPLNFGTVMMTSPSSVSDQGKSPRFGTYVRNSSTVGSPLLFVVGVNFPQWDIGKERCDEDPDDHRWQDWGVVEDSEV